MGNTESAISGMNDATRVMGAIPILGGAFQMQTAATGAGVKMLNGVGNLGTGVGSLLGNPVVLIGAGVVLLILIK